MSAEEKEDFEIVEASEAADVSGREARENVFPLEVLFCRSRRPSMSSSIPYPLLILSSHTNRKLGTLRNDTLDSSIR
jgi:hypothetical protein